MQTTTLNVRGMTCNHCKMRVEKAAGAVDGVSSASVDLAAGTVALQYDGNESTLERVKSTIDETGYEVA